MSKDGEPTASKAPKSANLAPAWKPGQSGNPAGRPKGARAKLGEDFLRALQESFTEKGREAVEKVRDERPADYLKVLASILPRELSLDEETTDALADVILQRRKRVSDV